jgi:antitoxin ParD1/3/4
MDLKTDAISQRTSLPEVVPAHQEYMRDPSKGVPADAILKRLKARRASRKNSRLL